MKRNIMTALLLVMMLVSLGGCWAGWDVDGRDGRSGVYDRNRGHDMDRDYDMDRGHERDGDPRRDDRR